MRCGDRGAQAAALRSIFLYLARARRGRREIVPLWDVSLRLFHEHLGKTATTVRVKVVRGLLDLIERERMGEKIDAMIKRVLRALSALGCTGRLSSASSSRRVRNFIAKKGTSARRRRIRCRITSSIARDAWRRRRRGAQLSRRVHRQGLMHVCEQGLIERAHRGYSRKGFLELMRQHRLEDLKRLHSLLSRMNGLDRLCEAFVSYLKQQGTAISRTRRTIKRWSSAC